MREADKNIKDQTVDIELLKENISNLHDTIMDLNYQLKIKDDENNVLATESLISRNLHQQVEGRITILTEEAERMKSENSILLSGDVHLKLDLDGKNEELLKLKQALQTTEFETNSLREENSLLLLKQEDLKMELYENKQKLSKLKQECVDTNPEGRNFEEKTGILSKVNESGIIIDRLKAQIEQLDNENIQLKLNISNLDLQIQSANIQQTDMKNALVKMEHERNSLVEEKMSLLRKIIEDGIDIDGLKAQIEKVEGEKAQLLLKMSDLDLELQSANLQLNDVRKVLVQTTPPPIINWFKIGYTHTHFLI
ncbi:hypothetical protein KSP40_PGU014428 [Platanthera guangdongensis]|uniref:Uncharacterized protein n=1 Tax=Platanthera guangdongensis TaxID=2320717 RepID=A0ABR2LEW5_9ASPA